MQNITSIEHCRWAFAYARASFNWLILACGARVALTVISLLKPWPMVILVDYALRNKSVPTTIRGLLERAGISIEPLAFINTAVGLTVLLFVAGWAAGLANDYVVLRLRHQLNASLSGEIFMRLQRRALQFHSRTPIADNMHRITTDCECVSMIVVDAFLPAVSFVATMAAMLFILSKIDITLTLISLFAVPYMAIVLSAFSKPLGEAGRKVHLQHRQIHALVEERLSAMPAMKAFNCKGGNLARFEALSKETLAATLFRSRTRLFFGTLLGSATAIGSASILWIGGQKALEGSISIGTILAFLSYLGWMYGPLEKLLQIGPLIQDAGTRASFVREVFEADQDIHEPPNAPPLKVTTGTVEFDCVSFGYTDSRIILRGVSFFCRPSQIIAIVGPSGGGKTTLMSLVPRFLDPKAGAVRIDGVNLREVQLRSVRESIGLVLQDPFLFPISIADNIAYGHPTATRAQIESAADLAGAHEFIIRLPFGYDTVLGERGATLSGGERQRISIARALVRNPRILIFDEPSSALDADSEAKLVNTLKQITPGRTILVVSHRLSTVRVAHSVIVLENGEIVETGTPERLSKAGGAFSRLFGSEPTKNATHGPTPSDINS